MNINVPRLANPTEINPDDVLRDYGIDTDVTAPVVTVIQRNDNIATVTHHPDNPVTTTTTLQTMVDMLEPPSLEITENHAPSNSAVAALTDDAIEEMLTEAAVMSESEEDVEESSVEETLQPEETPQPQEEPVNTTKGLSVEELLKLLPVNSKTFEIDESTSRFSGAAWYKEIQESTVLLAGLGGIGSYVFFCLSRMKPKQIIIYDDDIVELVNLSGQLYSLDMVGRTKVDAMALLARNFSDYYGVITIPQKYTQDIKGTDIMICGFDNMEARKVFFTSWLNHVYETSTPENCLFIDGRLALEEFQVYCLQGNDSYNIKRYTDECLFDDYEAERVMCSVKQTTYCSNMIGSIIVNLFTNFIANKLNPIIPRDLPFKTYYDASMMYFKTEV